MKSRINSTTMLLFLSINFISLVTIVGANNDYSLHCPPPPPCICNLTPSPSPNGKPPPPLETTPPQPPPQATTPPVSPPLGNICSKNDTELKICAEIVSIADGLLTAGRAYPCCSILRNLSDVDAVTCLCKSVGAKPFSLSPNFGIFFKVCGRRIPQGFICPGPASIASPPPPPPPVAPSLSPPPPQATPSLSPPPPPTTPSLSPPPVNICSKNNTELKICAEILAIADGNLSAGRANPCCSIVRDLSDVDAATCLCKSVGAKPFSLSPNFGIFFKVCGRRIPQGFSCPGPVPTTSPPPVTPSLSPPPPPVAPSLSPPPQATPSLSPHPPPTTPSLSPPPANICSKNNTELKICAEILAIADGNLSAGRANPCCSIVRDLSDVDAVTCLCKSVGAKPFSLSPNFGIFFKVCGRRIPQGFSCPGPVPTTSPPPVIPSLSPPPPSVAPSLSPPPQATPSLSPPPPPTTPSLSPPPANICSKNNTELKICAEILAIADGNLSAGRANPCCSIVRDLSDVDAVTCLCKSVGAKPFSLSPNFGIFFKICGRRIPQGFSCP